LFDQGRKDDGSGGCAEGCQFVDEAFEMLNRFDGYFNVNESAPVRDDIREPRASQQRRERPRKDIAYHADANKGPNRQADLCGIHLRAKTRDDPGVFHFADTFRDGGR